MKSQIFAALVALPLVLLSQSVRAELVPDHVHLADGKKTGTYFRDGLVTGGDQAVDEVVVKDIRRAVNPGFERIVVDLEGTRNGEPVAIARPPYYQVSVNPDENRVEVSVWGKPRLTFNSKKVSHSFLKSTVVKGVSLLPPLDPEVWTFVAELKGAHSVEVFELSNPVRIILDIKIK